MAQRLRKWLIWTMRALFALERPKVAITRPPGKEPNLASPFVLPIGNANLSQDWQSSEGLPVLRRPPNR